MLQPINVKRDYKELSLFTPKHEVKFWVMFFSLSEFANQIIYLSNHSRLRQWKVSHTNMLLDKDAFEC